MGTHGFNRGDRAERGVYALADPSGNACLPHRVGGRYTAGRDLLPSQLHQLLIGNAHY